MIDMQSTVARSPELVVTTLGNGELALLSIANGKYFSASPMGRRIWEYLEGPRTVEQIQQLIVAEYEVPAEKCSADLKGFLHEMIEARLLNVLA